MASDPHRNILFGLETEPSSQAGQVRLAAFVPILVAVVGVVGILLGGISARTYQTAERQMLDPMTTGSITVKGVDHGGEGAR